jgi:DNA-directed RNA polymerase specialized sigma24 family protein
MKPIEAYPDKSRCELCGALKTDGGVDPGVEHTASETIRRLAFIADRSPSLAVLLIHHVAGRTEREIAAKLHISPPAVHGRIARAQKTMLAICKIKNQCPS